MVAAFLLQASNVTRRKEDIMNTFVNVMHANTCNCAACAPVPTLGIKMPYEVVKENCLAVACPEAAAMLSDKDRHFAFEVTTGSKKRLTFVCPNCGQEFEVRVRNVVHSVMNGRTGCPVCAGQKVVPGINDLASKYPEIAAMWSSKNKLSASEVTAKSNRKAFFKCRDCGREFEAVIRSVVNSVNNGFTGCYECKMRRINAISKPECFVVRPMLAFAGENGIANPFFDVRNILGKNSRLGLDFVDHIQKLCAEYNGVAWHGDEEHVERDRFKFEAAQKAGYTMIRVQEPGLEVLDPKYDIVMPEGFYRDGKYDAEIMEEVGRKVIHLLEEIYGRKASPEIWALNNFKEFEVWYDANKKELEANARKKGPKGKTAAKMAA
jgi:transcription elongation factor Elf1